MNKAVLISIQHYWVFLIIARAMGWNIPQHKTVEVRKDFPKDPAWNKVVHIYCTKSKKSFKRIPKQYQPLMEKFLGKVACRFVCDKIDRIGKRGINDNFDYCFLSLNKWGNDDIEIEIKDIKKSSLTKEELNNYGKNSHELYVWHISDLKIYDKPKELWEFFGYGECEPDPIKCHACKYMEHGNSWAGIEADCNAAYDGLKQLNRPPQSWCYVEELSK